MSEKFRVLVVDIETSPLGSWNWGMWDQNIGLSQLRETSRIMCFAAKWHGERTMQFYSEYHQGSDEMINMAWKLLSEADAVVTWNGDKFDLPHFNREFIERGMGIPAPYASIDLLKTSRKCFKFPSNKLDYVAKTLKVGGKLHHTGFELWLGCMAGDPKAWALMQRYNEQDVRITDRVYDKLLPWIQPHPNVALHDGHSTGCPTCGSFKATREGYAYTSQGRYPRFRCSNCGKWRRSSTRDLGFPAAGVR